jgi:hypothetical protein
MKIRVDGIQKLLILGPHHARHRAGQSS